MTIKCFPVNPLGVNCFIAYDETKEGVIIDCGCSAASEWNSIKNFINAEGLSIKHMLNTHLHFDHVWGNHFVTEDLGLAPEASADDIFIYNSADKMIRSFIGISIPLPKLPTIGTKLADGDNILFGNTSLKVIATPGHTPGGLCFYSKADEVLFSGDTLFQCSMGRTDLDGGDQEAIMRSLQQLATLPDSTNVLCGHGPSTTIGYEKRFNPYL